MRTVQEYIDDTGPWAWPEKDYWGWSHPADHWPKIKEAVLKHSPGFKRIIQAGGCCGMYPRLFSNMFEQVITFEPDPNNFNYLVENCQGQNIIKVQAAVGQTIGMVGWVPPKDFNVGLGRVAGWGGSTPMIALDNFICYHVDVIQLDLEGGEYHALMGAQRIIKEYEPLICIEGTNDEIEDYLRTFGYELIEVIPSSAPDVLDYMYVRIS